MTAGILYATEVARGMLPRGLIEWLSIPIEPVSPNDKSNDFKNHFPLGKSPALLSSDGFELTEVLAILYYLVGLKHDSELEKSLYGSTLQERSQVIRFLSFMNHEIAASAFSLMTAAKTNANQEEYEDKVSKCIACIALLEQQLSQHEFLVNGRITIADLYAASLFGTLLTLVLGKDKMNGFKLIGKWLPKVLQHPALKDRVDASSFLERTIAPSSAK